MTIADSSGDPFVQWCYSKGYLNDMEAHFAEYMRETTGWDGRQFSLTEDERHWIVQANEVIEWLRLYSPNGGESFLDSALRALAGMRPMPKSLRIE